MDKLEQSREIRRKMESYSSMVNEALGQPENRVGIKCSSDLSQACPRCQSGLRRKAGIVKGRQRWQCLVCWKHYFEDDRNDML